MDWYHYVLIALGIIILFGFLPLIIVARYVFNQIFLRKNTEKDYVDFEEFKPHLKPYETLIRNNFKYLRSLDKIEHEIVSDDGLKLKGFYVNNNSDTTVIFVHGYQSTPFNSFSGAAKALHKKGYNLFFVYQRAHGKSEGQYVTFGIKERKDILKWTHKINEVYSPKNIIIYGISMGCATSSMALSLNMPSNVKCAVLDCGFNKPHKEIVHESKNMGKKGGEIIIYFVNIYCKLIAGFSLFETSASKSLSKVTIPCLFIHSEGDKMVLPINTIENYNACASKHKKMIMYPKVGHGLTYLDGHPDIENQMLKFVDNAINESW